MAKTRHKRRVPTSTANRLNRNSNRQKGRTKIITPTKIATPFAKTVQRVGVPSLVGAISPLPSARLAVGRKPKIIWDVNVTIVTSMRGRIHPMARQPGAQPQSFQNEFVDSTAISSYRYASKRKILEIIFVSGGSKQYIGVPVDVVRGLAVASSKGRYFHRMIYGTWSGKKGSKKYKPRYTEV